MYSNHKIYAMRIYQNAILISYLNVGITKENIYFLLISMRLTLAGAGGAAATTFVLASPSAFRNVGLE